jgi:agmatinase
VRDTEPTPGSETGRSGGARPHPFFLDLAPEYRDPERAAACILPVPYDATSSWIKGAGRGPAALISASNYVEVWDIETATEPYRHGIATLPPVEVDGPPEGLADAVEHRVGEILDRGQLPVMLGGEHSVTVGAVRAAAARVPGLSVLQIDAHADTRETYGGSAYNHACVMARVRERCPVVQVGIRSLDTSEVDGLDQDRVVFAHEIAAERAGAEDSSGARPWMERATGLLSEDVYVTIDVDAFDPSVMPATGTPEPGGLYWYEVNALLRLVATSRRIVAFDVVELLDLPGHHASAFTAAKLVHRFLAEIFGARPR